MSLSYCGLLRVWYASSIIKIRLLCCILLLRIILLCCTMRHYHRGRINRSSFASSRAFEGAAESLVRDEKIESPQHGFGANLESR